MLSSYGLIRHQEMPQVPLNFSKVSLRLLTFICDRGKQEQFECEEGKNVYIKKSKIERPLQFGRRV